MKHLEVGISEKTGRRTRESIKGYHKCSPEFTVAPADLVARMMLGYSMHTLQP